jgi:CheY-like chemotaxis protein
MTEAASRPVVLIVEDNPDLREVLETILRHHGFNVVTAGDGREAVDRVLERAPDLVLMDLMMPRMDGYEAIAAMNGSGPPPFPVVAVTASEVSRAQVAAHGFIDLLRKPVRARDLLATVERLTAA